MRRTWSCALVQVCVCVCVCVRQSHSTGHPCCTVPTVVDCTGWCIASTKAHALQSTAQTGASIEHDTVTIINYINTANGVKADYNNWEFALTSVAVRKPQLECSESDSKLWAAHVADWRSADRCAEGDVVANLDPCRWRPQPDRKWIIDSLRRALFLDYQYFRWTTSVDFSATVGDTGSHLNYKVNERFNSERRFVSTRLDVHFLMYGHECRHVMRHYYLQFQDYAVRWS